MGLFNRRPHGRWVEMEYRRGELGYACSECSREFEHPFGLCPACGAIMDQGIIDEAQAFEELSILLDDEI